MNGFSQLGQLSQGKAQLQSGRSNNATDRIKQATNGLDKQSESESGKGSFDKKLMDAAEKVEGYLVSFLMKQMRESVKDTGGMFKKGKAEKMFQSRLDDKLAQKMADSKDFGIAESVYNQFSADKAP